MGASHTGTDASRRRAALVVDPDPSIRDLLERILADIGIAAFGAGGNAEALAVLAREAIGLAFVEVLLPDGRGDALARSIAAHGGKPVLMSGHPTGVLHARASPYPLLEKPFRVKDVVRHAARLLPP